MNRSTLSIRAVVHIGLLLAGLPIHLSFAKVTLDTGFWPVANSSVYSLVLQPDGRILIGGLNGVNRVNPDGSQDKSMTSVKTSGGAVRVLALQPDGKVLVGGDFTMIGGYARKFLARVNAEGTLDASFNPDANAEVCCVAVQADGKILVGGQFTVLGGESQSFVGRLNRDGSLDNRFTPDVGGAVSCLTVQSDGKILLGLEPRIPEGEFMKILVRLNTEGNLDSSFEPVIGTLPYSSVDALSVQADGKILFAGYVDWQGAGPDNVVCRLNSDGTPDAAFDAKVEGDVYSLAAQASGKVLLGGKIYRLGGKAAKSFGRLNADGSLDTSFNAETDGAVCSLAVQSDGKILIGGYFGSLGYFSRPNIGRLIDTEPVTQVLTFSDGAITWLRGGGCPEVQQTTFEVTMNGGIQWFSLGDGTPISGGWELKGLTLPSRSTIRARGYQTGSFWFCESFAGPLTILSQPLSRTNDAGTTTSFNLQTWDGGQGSGTNRYQWRKNGWNLWNRVNLGGVQTANLCLTNVGKSDEGGYTVVIANLSGSITSAVAWLMVADPLILTQPSGLVRNSGETASFTVTPGGSSPFTYQWMKDGMALTGRTTRSITIANLSGSDAGHYSVAVSNRWGEVKSAAIPLTVNAATLDIAFDPGPNGQVSALALQPDGKILIGGAFSMLGGQPRANIGRVNPDGSLDAGFDPGADDRVFVLTLQADGKLLVGGTFSTLAGTARKCIGRLSFDGTLDTLFNPLQAGLRVDSITLGSDGAVLIGGGFTAPPGTEQKYFAKFNQYGEVDATVNPNPSGVVTAIAFQPDGKILFGGGFTAINGQSHKRIGRLNPDGSLDPKFRTEADGIVYSIVLQADGRILVGGAFTSVGDYSRTNIARLNPDGSVDITFNPGADGYSVGTFAVQADGKILVGGEFSKLGGQARGNIGRLNPDGSLDPSFDPGANAAVRTVTLQADGGILVGGQFTKLGGKPCNYIARLNSTGPMLPRIASVAPSLGLSDDGFGFNFTGVAGSYVVIEGSPDLENWSPIQTNFLNTSVSTFRDPAVTNTPTRYYRVKVQQP